uniref:DNA polymerase n=1 Tax=Porodaedalea chrysoloma TaxID=74615 RepID=UPI0023AA85E0|nr:DNA polymerase [Porodaedalea chrysoloma]WCF76752.1 DNA polymerase [Porodaedalea chrysoloma]
MIQLNKTQENNIKYIILNFNNFDLNSFIEALMYNLQLNTTYTLLIKFAFQGNSLFYMSGSQIGMVVKSSHNIDYYNKIYEVIRLRIEDVISKYDIDSLPDSIVIEYKVITVSKDLIINNIDSKSLNLNNKIFPVNKLTKIFSSKYLPLTLDSSYFGFRIETELKYKIINRLISNIKSSGVQLSGILNNSELLSKTKLFIRSGVKGLSYIILDRQIEDQFSLSGNIDDSINNLNIQIKLAIENLKNKNKIKLNNGESLGSIRTVFELTTGICLLEAIDLRLDNLSFVRIIDNYCITIKNNKVIEISRAINFEPIKNPYVNESYKIIPNPNFGVLDIETFQDSDGLGKVYCMGYVTLLEKNKIETFYLSDLIPSLDSNLLIILCINSMLVPKYHNYIWYIHNMGNFDIIYIYKTLKEFNLHYQQEYYKLETLYKENKMLRLTVKVKSKNNKYIKITFFDSLNILSSSLSKLAKDFGVETQKGFFPYNFVNKESLNYIGETPDMKYYKNISPQEYKEIYSKYFISNKTYCLSLLDNSTIIKAKGVKNDSLTLEDFKSMYFSFKNILSIKPNTIKNLSKGSVIISEKEILLQYDSFTKREKLYSESKLWVNTKPLYYNNIEKSIIPIN